MTKNSPPRIAILYPGDLEVRRNATPENNRFSDLFKAFTERAVHVEPAVYHDDFCDEVREQLERLDGVLVWLNPIQDGRNRSVLDSMLRDIASDGIFVSTHPDVILKLGTKEVLYRTQGLGWGCDTHLYGSLQQMRQELPMRLAAGKARVLKRLRGHSGEGVWKVRLSLNEESDERRRAGTSPLPGARIAVRHAKRGCVEEETTLEQFCGSCEEYFAGDGGMIDQEYQARLPEGMIRCYLVHDKVAGFGHQAINALYPAPPGADPALAPQPGLRLYHADTKPEFQSLKQILEQEWVPAVQRLLGIDTERLPILWDCDFLLGPRGDDGADTYVLCEINVSSVAPYPESAVERVCDATVARVQESRRRRGLVP